MSLLNNFSYQLLGTPGATRLVFLHGLMGGGANWRKITSQMNDKFEMLIYDQRGHGRSFKPESGYSPEDYAKDLEDIVTELGWERFHLVGHSMGGRNALNYAANFSQRIIKLVIEDISPAAHPEDANKTRRLLDLVPTPFENKLAARDFFRNEYEHLIPEHPQPRVISQYFYTNIEQKPDGTADWRFSRSGILESLASGREKDRWDEFTSLKMPTLVVRGEDSEAFSEQDYRQMLNTNSNVKGIQIEQAGHWVHADQPQEFASALLDFFES